MQTNLLIRLILLEEQSKKAIELTRKVYNAVKINW